VTEHEAETAEIPSSDDGFAAMVVDLVRTGGDDHDIIQGIVDAYRPRIEHARARAEKADRVADAYAAMDRAQQEVLKYVRAIVGQLAMANSAHMARLDSYDRMRKRISELTVRERGLGADGAYIHKIEEIMEGDWAGHEVQRNPVPCGLAVDTRYVRGHFTRGDVYVTMPFIGWTMTVYSRFGDSQLEATFLSHNGIPVTRTELAATGALLTRLS
jgi:hypothetical protein